MNLQTYQRTANARHASFSRLALACAIALGLFTSAEQARAEYFTYVASVPTGGSTLTPINGATISLNPLSVNTPGDNLDATAPDGTDIVFGQISVTGVTRTSVAESISIPYTFQIALSDYATDTDSTPLNGSPVMFDISGTLTGTIGPGKKVNISNSFSQPLVTHAVGSDSYQFSLFSYVAPGIVNDGAFGAHVVVQVIPSPEPASITLLGLGTLAFAIPAYRRCRRASRASG